MEHTGNYYQPIAWAPHDEEILKKFIKMYRNWCEHSGYYFDEDKALDIYAAACGHIGLMPKTEGAELLVHKA